MVPWKAVFKSRQVPTELSLPGLFGGSVDRGSPARREAAKMLLCLNSTEPVARGDQAMAQEGASPPPAAAAASKEDPQAAAEDAPTEAGNASIVSPLQALVQDIMQQQKQRAQVGGHSIRRKCTFQSVVGF